MIFTLLTLSVSAAVLPATTLADKTRAPVYGKANFGRYPFDLGSENYGGFSNKANPFSPINSYFGRDYGYGYRRNGGYAPYGDNYGFYGNGFGNGLYGSDYGNNFGNNFGNNYGNNFGNNYGGFGYDKQRAQ